MQIVVVSIHMGLFFVFSYINIIIHETGHLLAALLTGIPVKKVFIGNGTRIFSWSIGSLEIILTNGFKGGLTVFYPDSTKLFKIRFTLFTSGGILFQTAILLIVSRYFDFNFSNLILSPYIDYPVCFFWASAISIFFNVIPTTFTYKNTVFFNDGLFLALLPFLSKEKMTGLIVAAMNNNGVYLMEKKNYREARQLLMEALDLFPSYHISSINLSAVMIKSGKIDEAISVLEKIDLPNRSIKTAASVLNNLAWAYLMKFDRLSLLKAGKFSKMACEMDPDNQKCIQNRAAVLIANNDYESGLQMLKSIDEKKRSALTLLFMAYAYWQSGNSECAVECFNRSETIDDSGDSDYLILKEKIVRYTRNFGIFRKSA